ncbi:LemA family protein [Candidatus Peribacteria bacterium]|nr:LemA family protein [Candidatus Peribacteria bacterium]
MSKYRIVLVSILGVAILAALWAWTTYNGLVRANEGVVASWAQVETQYQRRFDLIPNLQATVQGAADFEQETFTAVTQARTQWQQAATRGEQIEAAGAFDSALSRLLVTVENYPQLQATQAFRDFMVQLEGTENRIAVARRDYNDAVRGYNVYTKVFPRNMVAGMFGFEPATFFESEEDADTVPVVEF